MVSQQDVAHAEPFLEHYGVKGMKWGVRKSEPRVAVPTSTSHKPGDFVRAKGGQNQPASEDAVRVAGVRQKAKASTTDALSNKELQDLVTRMNLEQQYSSLMQKSDRRSKGAKFVNKILGNAAARDVAMNKIAKSNPGAAKKATLVANVLQQATAGPKKKK